MVRLTLPFLLCLCTTLVACGFENPSQELPVDSSLVRAKYISLEKKWEEEFNTASPEKRRNTLTINGPMSPALKTGDIFLARYGNDNAQCRWSNLPFLKKRGYWCHAAMLMSDGYVLEAVGTGKKNALVKLSSFVSRYQGGSVAVLRARNINAGKQAADYAYLRRNRWYLVDVPKTSLFVNYCSQLVWLSYKNGSGIDIDKNGGLMVFPDDISLDGDLYLFTFLKT